MTKKLNSDEIDLLDVLYVIWEKKWIVILFTVLSLSISVIFVKDPTPSIIKNKIRATTEVRPIEFYDEAKYNMFSSVLKIIAKLNSNYIEDINRSEYDEKAEKAPNLQEDEIYNITTSISREFLLNLFTESLDQRSYLTSAIKRFNLIEEENYSNEQEYDEAIMEFASSIKLLNADEKSIEKEYNVMIEVEAYKTENWRDFLEFIEKEINAKIQLKLSNLFNNYIDYSREIKNFKIEDIEDQLLAAQTQNEVLVLVKKKNIILEDKYVERMVSIFKRLPFSSPKEFYAARIIYDSTKYKILKKNIPHPPRKITRYFWVSLLGVILGILFVLVSDAIQKNRRR